MSNIPIRETFPVEQGRVSGVHFGRKDNPLKVVFLHANGMNALAYRALLEPTGRHCLALDLRGHGFTDLPTNEDEFSGFDVFARDVCDVLDQITGPPIILAGHSLGASTAILVAKMRPDKVSAVLAYDPIVLPNLVRLMMRFKLARKYFGKHLSLAKKAAKKRAQFESMNAALEHYKGRGFFKHITPESVNDFVTGGVREHPNGGVKLACDPAWEKAVYVGQSHNLVAAIKHLPRGSHAISTDYFGSGRRIKKASAKSPNITLVERTDLEHFFPLINVEFSSDYLSMMINNINLD